VEKLIGADWLLYQDLEDLVAACSEGNPQIRDFESAVFNGQYITGDVDEMYLRRLEAARNDAAKKSKKGHEGTTKQQNLVADLSGDS
jgi:amidophosphoribosyltransferase